MSPERKIEADKIHLLQIKTLKGNIDAASDADTNAIAGHQFIFELGTGINIEENIVGLKLLVNIEARDKSDNPLPITGSYTHEIIFKVENLKDFIETGEENGAPSNKIDGALGSTLFSIVYSTVRGIIFTRTQGTSLGSVILPVYSPKKLMGLE